jgi:Subtilase family
MQEPSMDFYFEPRRNDQDAGRDGANTAPGLVTLPEALLQRHGARVLNPEDAVALPDQPTPRSTVYRARTLLVPGFILDDAELVGSVNTILARVGMSLEATPAPVYPDLGRVNPDLAIALQRLPRVAGLNPLRHDSETARPHVVDAWVALQTLREAVARQQPEPGQPEVDRDQTLLSKTDIDQFALEHLLISSSIGGAGAHGSGGGLTPGASGGGTGAGPTDSYTFFSGDTRFPVAVCLDQPERRDCAPEHGRRPVVAVLDTGIRAHPWLDVTKAATGDGYDTYPDGFVMIDQPMQVIIRDKGKEAVTAGDQQRQVIWHPWDTPVTADPLIGELDTDTGHCTFISGIVRQVAPDARVLAIRIMHSDGIVNEGDLLCALSLLAYRVALAQAPGGDMNDMVDVASLSFGYFSEAEDSDLTSGLETVIGKLLDLGVTVVAAAGNYSTSRKFYPAAFVQSLASTYQVPLISVGALNPNRSQAVFSDGGRWITAWARGAIMISTFPVDIQGSLGPEIRTRMHPDNALPDGADLPGERASLDPDDYRGGWAAWSGTSFSAPLVAAHIAKALLSKELKLWLDDKGEYGASERAIKRAMAALKSLRWEG